jgi:hypothetical protein
LCEFASDESSILPLPKCVGAGILTLVISLGLVPKFR